MNLLKYWELLLFLGGCGGVWVELTGRDVGKCAVETT